MVLGLFGGPGGWAEALRSMGRAEVGIEWDAAACATRAAAGHLTIRADVSTYPTGPFVGKVVGLIASPPCPTFSAAGKGEGRDDFPHLHTFTAKAAREGWHAPAGHHEWADPRTPLVLEPLRWVEALRPEWVALEQVPAVLPLWEQYAAVWRDRGYSTWAGVLNSADFGVPQTRRRAFCLASRTRVAAPPPPTHCQGGASTLMGELAPWVSMADALGWGMTDRASYTVTGGGTNTGGAEPIGNGARRAMRERESKSLATEGCEVPGMTARHGERRDHPADEPAPTLTSKARSDVWVVDRRTNSKAAGGGHDPDRARADEQTGTNDDR